jgi:hypothetical protein
MWTQNTFTRICLVISVDTSELLLKDDEKYQLWTRDRRQIVDLERSMPVVELESLKESTKEFRGWSKIAKAVEEAYDFQAGTLDNGNIKE